MIKAGPGVAWPGGARHGVAGQGRARQGKARHGEARHGTARHGKAGRGRAWRGEVWLGAARQGAARQGFFFTLSRRLSMSKASTETPTTNHNRVGPLTLGQQGTKEKLCRTVTLNGLTPIMFDRYPGDNDTKLEPWQKLYFRRGTKELCLPMANIMSFLSAQNTDSAPKRILDSRKYKVFALACASYVMLSPDEIPFLRDGKPIEFGKLNGEVDELSGVWIKRDVARLEKGIPNPKVRPVLPLPWSLKFTLTLFPNKTIQEQQLLNVMQEGGICLGLGTWRGQYGKFEIASWE